MKILEVQLLAFGPFTETTLSFDQGSPGLHLVYGPNEAGKSTSLRALKQWLFGIPHRTSDNFLHPKLIIGGKLQKADGTIIEAIRQKGRTKTLRAAGGVEVLDDALFEKLLNGVNEAAFGSRFGIDFQELRRGGNSIVQGSGDLGEILFAAGAGLGNLGPVQKSIEEEAASYFTPRGRGGAQRINKTLADLKEIRDEIKQRSLPSNQWMALKATLKEAEQKQEEIDKQLTERRIRFSQWERMLQALPVIGRWKQARLDLASVADAPQLPIDFSQNRISLLAEKKGALEAKTNAAAAADHLQREISQLDFSQEIVEHRTAITSLYKELGSIQKAERDRPGLVAKREAEAQGALRILQELGHAPDLDSASQVRLTRGQKQRIQELAADFNARVQQQRSEEEALQNLRDQIKRVESRLESLPEFRDVSELERTIRRIEKQEDLDDELALARKQLRVLEEQAQRDLARLAGWNGSLEELENSPAPILETVDRFEQRFQESVASVKQCQQKKQEWKRQFQEIERQLKQLELELDVPSEEDLRHAREDRDLGWNLVQQILKSGDRPSSEDVNEFIERHPPAIDLPSAFRISLEAADLLADRLRREAERVASKAKLAADQNRLEQQLAEICEELESAEARSKSLEEEWNEVWKGLGIVPLSPREMRSWLNQYHQLIQTAGTIRHQREEVAVLAERRDSLFSEMRDVLHILGETISENESSLSVVLQRSQGLVDQIGGANRTRQELERQRDQLLAELQPRERALEGATRSFTLWQEEWEQAIAIFNLNRSAPPTEVNAVMESVEELQDHLKEYQLLGDRISGIERDANEFRQAVDGLFNTLTLERNGLPAERAIQDLYDRLEQASATQATLATQQEQLQKELRIFQSATSRYENCEKELAAMCRLAGCDSIDELPSVEEKAQRKQKFESDLNAARDRLNDLAAGRDIEEFISAADQYHPDQLQADLQKLGEEIQSLQEKQKEVSEQVGKIRGDLQRMDGSDAAAQAQEQAEHLLASLRNDAEQFIQLRLASALLKRAVDRYRESGQGPVLQRASELFQRLTLGSFQGIRADYNESGNAVLVGVRPDGQTVLPSEGMSEGTGDQLYLALRIALLESYLDPKEPIPFIIDDILVMFDDERTIAALKILGELSRKTQVIYFTHHEHVRDLAVQNIPKDVLFVQTLNSRNNGAKKRSGNRTLSLNSD